MSEWPSTYICILGYSGPQWTVVSVAFRGRTKTMIAVALKGARSIKEQSQVHELMNIIFSSGQRQTEEGEGEGRKGR